MSELRKIAIACQGGGSHAAFAAGVLDSLLEAKHATDLQLVGLSGTSGGALCAALAWRGIVSSGPAEARKRLFGFWNDLIVRDPIDAIANFWQVWASRAPIKLEVSPYLYEPVAETRLRALLRTHLELESLGDAPNAPDVPVLLVGATDVLNGERIVFRGESLNYDALIASAAVPPLFRAVHADGRAYWDGLFTTNPPVREFTDLPRDQVPDEVWVIQVNPQQRREEPRTSGAIIDRSNELAGNLSLGQELFFIDKINGLIRDYPALEERYKPIIIRVVALPDEALDLASKYDRRADIIEGLIDRGRKQAVEFFGPESIWPRPDTAPRTSASAPATPEPAAQHPAAPPQQAGTVFGAPGPQTP